MITDQQIKLLKLILKRGEITTRHGLEIYKTYKGFYFSAQSLELEGLIKRSKMFGTWFYSLTHKGKNFIKKIEQ